jgi:hypothetical protein
MHGRAFDYILDRQGQVRVARRIYVNVESFGKLCLISFQPGKFHKQARNEMLAVSRELWVYKTITKELNISSVSRYSSE